ncbi:MAG: hypothetical protein QM657_09100 [Lacrimispora sp.]|uniref:hypothetical protein n=1 Tax=Lacrimispora sp. TaxID=2719234 RepID=UPI0039E496E5
MKIFWSDHLYVGEKARRKRYRIIRGIRKSRPVRGSYVITPASDGNNILDICPASLLVSPFYPEKELLVIGIAASYWEALEVARCIVDEMYGQTGGFDLLSFIGGEARKV